MPCPPPAKRVQQHAVGMQVACRCVHRRLEEFWGLICGLKANQCQQQVHTPGVENRWTHPNDHRKSKKH